MTHSEMILLLDIGNTHTHLGLAGNSRPKRQADIPTASWFDGSAPRLVRRFVGKASITGAAVCSVVPRATVHATKEVGAMYQVSCLELTHKTLRVVEIDYPRPETIGPDRLANAVAAKAHFGVPTVVVDFGTAVTFDVVDRKGRYVGGIIAPGLSAMTDYLHEKTALLPRIKIREIKSPIGRSTEEAMLVGTVHGYRGLIRELILELQGALKTKKFPVIATGGYASLISSRLPEITAVDPLLTLEGLRLVWQAHQKQ